MKISSRIKRSFEKTISMVFSDPNLYNESIYKRLDSIQFDDSTGTTVESYTDFPVRSIRCDKKSLSIVVGNTVQDIASTETSFIIQAPLPANASTVDQILCGEDAFTITEIQNLFDAAFLVKTRGI